LRNSALIFFFLLVRAQIGGHTSIRTILVSDKEDKKKDYSIFIVVGINLHQQDDQFCTLSSMPKAIDKYVQAWTEHSMWTLLSVWLVVVGVTLHFVSTLYETWHSATHQQLFIQAEHTRQLCEQNTLVRIDPDMGKICSDRRKWYASSYGMNIMELVVLDHLNHINEVLHYLRFKAWCGPVCTYQITKITDAITSSLFWLGPVVMIVFVLLIVMHRRTSVHNHHRSDYAQPMTHKRRHSFPDSLPAVHVA
jgi:hypothetical protein